MPRAIILFGVHLNYRFNTSLDAELINVNEPHRARALRLFAVCHVHDKYIIIAEHYDYFMRRAYCEFSPCHYTAKKEVNAAPERHFKRKTLHHVYGLHVHTYTPFKHVYRHTFNIMVMTYQQGIHINKYPPYLSTKRLAANSIAN